MTDSCVAVDAFDFEYAYDTVLDVQSCNAAMDAVK